MAKKRSGPFQFLREVRQEGSRVTWTGRKELIASTIFVLIFVTIAALFFFFVDWALGSAVRLALNFVS